MKLMRLLIVMVATSTLLMMLLIGCSDDSSINPAGNVPEEDGQIRMYLVDAPADYDAVNIVIDRVEVHGSDGNGWIVVSDSNATYNLLELTNGANVILADEYLEPGHYTQIRLYLEEGSQVVVDGVPYDLDIPSSIQSGLKLNHPFDIVAQTLYEVILDFNAEQSIHETGAGQYTMNPVIRVIATAVSGDITGIVDPADALAFIWTVADEDTIGTYADPLSGEFTLVAIPEGVYDVTVSPTAGVYQDSTITDVTVTALETTDLGTIVLQP